MKNKSIIMDYSVLVAILNIFDGFITNYGIMNNIIEEMNPIMEFLWVISPVSFLCIKIFLSFSILCVSYMVYKKSKASFQKLFLFSLAGVLVIYAWIFCMHTFWLSLL